MMLTAPTTYRGLAIHIMDQQEPPLFFVNLREWQLSSRNWKDLKEMIDETLDDLP